jgi:hypothetical protein
MISIVMAFIISIPFVVLIGAVAMPEYLLMSTVFISGMCLLGGQIGLNALAGTMHPTFVRSSGAGWALGIGRIGSILGPVIGGVLIGVKLSMPWLFVCAAIPGACCAVTVLALQAVVTRKSAREAEPELRAGKMSRRRFGRVVLGSRDTEMMGPAPFARLVLLQMRSDRTPAPFMPMPPDHDSNSHYCRQNQHQQQGRIFNPCNRRNAKRHDQAKQANLPGKNVHAGGEGAERKQREDREAGRSGVQNPLHACQEHHVHHKQERDPVQ